jgi:hypothetical protein
MAVMLTDQTNGNDFQLKDQNRLLRTFGRVSGCNEVAFLKTRTRLRFERVFLYEILDASPVLHVPKHGSGMSIQKTRNT